MKTLFSAILGSIILTTGATSQSAHAQTPSIASNNANLTTVSNYNASSVDTIDKTNIAKPIITIHQRALKDFTKFYKQAKNEYWLTAKNGGFVVGFMAADIKTYVTYNKKGRWMYAIKRYDESQLAKQIKTDIRYAYPDYTILGAEEITVPQKLIYLVHIFKGTKLITLRICDNEMEEIETFDSYQEGHQYSQNDHF